MHLTDHLTDVQLNEYLDEATDERAQIDSHLSSCDECAARLTTLQNLFAEIESLPELALTRDFAAPFMRTVSLPAQLPRFLTLTVILQAAIALIALAVAAPFVTTYVPQIDTTSLLTPLFEIQSLWNVWLDTLSTFEMPTLPEIPVLEMSS